MNAVLQFVLRLLVGGVFTFSGILKGVSPSGSAKFISFFTGASSDFALILAVGLAVFEVSVGLILLTGFISLSISSLCASALLLAFVVIGAPLVSEPIPCGCFGGFLESQTDEFFLVRNLLLFFASLSLLRLSTQGQSAPKVTP